MKQIGKLTLTIDMKEHVARSREVLDEIQRRINSMDPGITEDDALKSLLLDITYDYLEAVKYINKTE
ncbi:TPA: hypothetical protein JEL63_003390 [Salmonella enterica subsp. enterica serovar Enteritidis]|uniref:hypothetical protein n=1 Tax=Salmonella enterica TaxID=28901 RepID=UPI0002A6CC83|nr:hypothetical protein [Salmonella enterica]EIZ8586515.1 hypothetical protein [Salmonella enterica subsp. enterica]ELO78611.1 hypothetical protein SEEERB17_010152 [Salmonella enterica subsp. enterica serovar Enteritidis str. SARB17]HAE4696941.1 hypothetical protein [Salmonella enterica subsp. enterica serovar Enteritidis]HAU6873961.1 hypothetical protein [Salmonella enterica subsp. enterica serovar Enteritidis]